MNEIREIIYVYEIRENMIFLIIKNHTNDKTIKILETILEAMIFFNMETYVHYRASIFIHALSSIEIG